MKIVHISFPILKSQRGAPGFSPVIRFNLVRINTRSMPSLSISAFFYAPVVLLMLATPFLQPVRAVEGISSYYLRYDILSHRNQLKEERLTMVPVENEFRAENFSLCRIGGHLSLRPGESKPMAEKRVREQTLKSLLREKGLQSVKTMNFDTIVSYEGVVTPPIRLEMTETRGKEFHFRAGIRFSPLAFPDQWESLQSRHRIKQAVQDFFLLFQ